MQLDNFTKAHSLPRNGFDSSVVLDRAQILSDIPNLVHGFSRRVGGISREPFGTLNLSTVLADNRKTVEENRRRVLVALERPDAHWVSLQQIHGADIVEVTERAGNSIAADGLCTRDRQVVCSILVADCVPILFGDVRGRVVAAAHAGWRGTRKKIAQLMVQRLGDLNIPASDLRVAMGPAIGPCCFEVGADVQSELAQAFAMVPEAFTTFDGEKTKVDLWRLNTAALIEAGVALEHIEILRMCTVCNEDFFSHRRDHGQTGRQAALIGFRR